MKRMTYIISAGMLSVSALPVMAQPANSNTDAGNTQQTQQTQHKQHSPMKDNATTGDDNMGLGQRYNGPDTNNRY